MVFVKLEVFLFLKFVDDMACQYKIIISRKTILNTSLSYRFLGAKPLYKSLLSLSLSTRRANSGAAWQPSWQKLF